MALATVLAVATTIGLPLPAAGQESVVDGAIYVHNDGGPARGSRQLQLEELWRRGGEDDEVFFGLIGQVQAGPNGDIYIMDRQQSHVEVFTAEGDHLRTLSREGDGPGESRQPEDMLFMPDGTLGLVQYFSGRIVKIATDGTPAGTLFPPGSGADGGGMPSIRRARFRGGNFVVDGARIVPLEAGIERRQYLASWNEAGEQRAIYVEATTRPQLMTEGWIEKRQYFPEGERWTLGPEGRVYAARDRDTYAVSVFAPDGTLERIIKRPLRPRRRTAEEKEEIAAALVVIRDGERIRINVEVEDLAPAISEIWVRDDGSIWVLPSPGERDQPAGVMQTYDVFDPRGLFVEQVAIRCEGDPSEDRLLFFAPQRAALIRGAHDARQNMFGGGEDEGADDAPVHEVVIYGYGERR